MSEGTVNPARVDPREILTAREQEVLDAVELGLTNGEIARRLHVSVHAVKFHLAAIYRKLNVVNRTEAVAVSLRAKAFTGDVGQGLES